MGQGDRKIPVRIGGFQGVGVVRDVPGHQTNVLFQSHDLGQVHCVGPDLIPGPDEGETGGFDIDPCPGDVQDDSRSGGIAKSCPGQLERGVFETFFVCENLVLVGQEREVVGFGVSDGREPQGSPAGLFRPVGPPALVDLGSGLSKIQKVLGQGHRQKVQVFVVVVGKKEESEQTVSVESLKTGGQLGIVRGPRLSDSFPCALDPGGLRLEVGAGRQSPFDRLGQGDLLNRRVCPGILPQAVKPKEEQKSRKTTDDAGLRQKGKRIPHRKGTLSPSVHATGSSGQDRLLGFR